jgi:hypothetical protein
VGDGSLADNERRLVRDAADDGRHPAGSAGDGGCDAASDGIRDAGLPIGSAATVWELGPRVGGSDESSGPGSGGWVDAAFGLGTYAEISTQ